MTLVLQADLKCGRIEAHGYSVDRTCHPRHLDSRIWFYESLEWRVDHDPVENHWSLRD